MWRVGLVDEDTFNNCVNLESIDLSANYLDTIEAKTFRKNVKLIELDLSYNNIRFLAPTIFEKNTKLEKINLRHNKLYALMEYTFAFTKVKQLYLQDNQLTNFNLLSLLCNTLNLEIYGFNGNYIECDAVKYDLDTLSKYQIAVDHKTETAETSEMAYIEINGIKYYCIPDVCNT